MSRIAREFLSRCFRTGETIALLLRREKPASTTQRVVVLERALEPRYLAWLSHENRTGANVYIGANPLRSGSRKRTKANIDCVRHLYLDIDMDGDARLAKLQASDSVPTPTAILSTSPGKYQVLWQVEGFDFALQEHTLKMLSIAFGGDPACTDCNRVLRLPGFLNWKYDPAHHIQVIYPSDCICAPGDFRLEAVAVPASGAKHHRAFRELPAKHSNSELDWAWVCEQLAHGRDAQKLTRELASRRADKPNPLYYAQRTIDVASARLWLIEGIRIDDVITMLEFRRRFDIPAAIAGARAREIATTAERMISRKKSA
jgi:RepB DNA-primase from phage plasmid